MTIALLPAPTFSLGLVYFAPTLAGFALCAVLWRRLSALPDSERAKQKSNLLGFFALLCAMAGALVFLIKWPGT